MKRGIIIKILYITTLSRTINAFLVPHIEKLINDGNTVDCACSIDMAVNLKLKNMGVKFFDIPFKRNPFHPINIKALMELIKIQEEFEYDIVHVHTPIAALYGRLLKVKFTNIKTIYTVHGFHFYKGAPIFNWGLYYPIERLMGNFTDKIITMNSEDYERAQKFKVKETYKLNGVGLDLDLYKPDLVEKIEIRSRLNLDKDDFVVLMIAEINQNKNHKQVISAIEILKIKGINIKLICAGDGPLLSNLEKEITVRGLKENIQLLGFRNDINELIAACDIGILTSIREGLPRNIMELMACKKPVIGTNIRGVRDLVIDSVNGFLVNVNDSEETAKKIEVLFNKRDLLNDMGVNAYKFILDYHVEHVIEDLLEVYG
ncbi:glycosyltransferase family 4 protein [Gottfriedia acidiceleris]|uniref:glycosyltransferase family 4 protein n=1 Tax=Gottfriedia acidiceleris TaxID=371036 RepID=UPI00101BF75E|nr:glycosyltransferase family 4 protein [Gottfriedia acidiceleris]